MGYTELKDKIYWIGVNNPELRVFDIIMETKRGTTYNSYLINDEKVAVIDTVKEGYFDEFSGNIKGVIGDRKVDYIVVQHTEFDHSGSLKQLLQEYPEATVVGSKAAMIYTKQILNGDFKFDDSLKEISLGETSLKFITAPNLHWPDTIFTYVQERKVLFTCDFLGCHYCPVSVSENVSCLTDSCSGDYLTEMKYYFDVIMGPFKKFVNMALEKIKNLEIDIIAPSHGPVHDEDYQKYLNLYKEWAVIDAPKEKNIQVFYISAYGNTEVMAKYMADGLNKRGIKAEVHEITSTPMEKIVELVEKSSGIMVGSPTINQDAVKPAWDMLSMICPIINKGKAATAFGSYGWSGEGVPMLLDRLKGLKFSVNDSGLRFKFVPSEEDFKSADELLDNFIAIIK